ncbi:uncharacterized protein LOC111085628 [Limulus polyphemus]|uniref:Uncharacterized protein LOC111085628 n=1 Tax=Limulus polyphemus TaxID=6850 RepID=A0ABM1SB21_LIMPO|nr:uncharacterized protein LOC111085628 [Limulus polyphemus]
MAGLSITLLLLYIRFHLLQVLALEAQDNISQGPPQDPRKFSTALSLDDVYEQTEYVLDHLPFDCNGKPDGAYPDYQRACKFFYLCERGQTHVFWCFNGTIFNSDTGHCDLAHRVRCVDPEKSTSSALVGECMDQEDGVYTDYASGCSGFYLCRGGQKVDFRCPENKRFDWRIGSCRDMQEVPCFQLSCENKPDGLYADYVEGCKRYYLCRGSERLEYICPPGKIFNEQILKCDHPNRVQCFNSSTFNCNGMPDGYYPQYDNGCRAFHLCIKNKPKSFSCPANLAFSKRPLACDYPSKANCEKPAISECRNKSNGIYVLSETGCREFLICRDGHVTHLGACAQGKLMNPATWRCDHRSLVKCSSAKDPDCEGKPDGMYPDINTGCSAYYVCISHRRILTQYCPESTLFDASVGSCLESPLVYCQNSPVLTSVHQWSMSHYGCEGRIGLFPDFISDCNRYYICAYGRKELMKCPEGKRFSAVTKQCQESNSVSCIAPKILGNFRCLQGDEGIYMDVKSDCTKWHECWGEAGWTYLCPKGSRFNVVTRSCDISDKEDCQNIGEELFRPYTFNSQIIRVLQKTDSTFSCREKLNGIYSAGALSCRLFYICANEYAFSYMCPENLMYNFRTESCDDPIRVNCQQVQDPWTEDNDDFSCSLKTDGMYPDYSTNCQKYFICENGQKMTVYCPKHHLFNTLTMVCELESQVKCRLPLYDEYQVPQENVKEHVITNERRSNNSTIDQSHKNDSSEGFKPIGFTETQNKTNAFSNEKNLRNETRLTNEKQPYHGKMFTEKDSIYQRDEMMKETNYPFFSDVLVTTRVPNDYEYFNYEIYDIPESYSAKVEKEGETYGKYHRVMVIAGIAQDKTKDGVRDETFYETQLPYERLEYDDVNRYDTPYNVETEDGTVVERPRIATTTTSILKEGLEYFRNTAQLVGLGNTNETNSVVKDVKEKYSVTPSMRSRISPPSSSSSEYEGGSQEPSINKSNIKSQPNESASQKYYFPVTKTSSQENTLSPLRKSTLGEEASLFPRSTRRPHTVTYRLIHHTSLPAIINPPLSTQQYSIGETDFSSSSIRQSDETASDSSLTNEHGFECPEGETGFFPDYESGCKQFHICYRNIKKTYSCPSVLLFNPESKNCDLPKNVFCQTPKLSSVKDMKCEERMNGYYPDFKSGCRQYYACFQDQVFLYTCSTGKLFNPRTMACDLAETVLCVNPEKPTTDITMRPKASNVVDKMSKPAHVHGVPHRFLFDCSNKPDGFYPDYARSCHVFYRCKDGKKISHYCKQGFLFNADLGICDFEENVTCTSPTNDNVTEQL